MSRQPISYPIPAGFAVPGPSASGPSGYGTNGSAESNGYNPSPRPSFESGQAESSSHAIRKPSGQRAPRAPSSGSSAGAIDSHVTRLLVHTKQILQAVTAWGQGEVSEEGVSEIFVRLGNEFTNCIVSFRRAGVAVDELKGIPDKLRSVLERCLAEEPSIEVVNLYIPTVRNIIFDLLTGLKQKQAAYKRLMTERSATPPPQPAVQLETPLPPPPPIDPPSAPRLSARSHNSSQSIETTSPASISSSLPQQLIPSSHALAERAKAANRPAPPDAFRPPRRVPSDTTPQPSHSRPFGSSPQDPPLVRHQLVDNPVPSPPPSIPTLEESRGPPPKPIPHPDRFSRDSLGRHISRFSADSEAINGSPARSTPTDSPHEPLVSLNEDDESQAQTALPPSLPTLNLPSANLDFDDSSRTPPPSLPASLPDVTPETRRTLAALSRSDALERRASKRFSSYTFNKLPGSPGQNMTSSGSPQRPTRRADRPPPMPPLPESLQQSGLGLGAPIHQLRSSPITGLSPPSVDHGDLSSSPNSTRTTRSDTSESQEGSVRIVKTPELPEEEVSATPRPPGATSPVTSNPISLSIFLQIGRHVKKTKVEMPVSLSSLRLLFMDKFDYDPGVGDFPDVYLRDPATGVQFELEDMEELKEGSVLSLDIEPLDQVKQHVDEKFAAIMLEMKQELKDMKSSLEHSRRLSVISHAPPHLAPSPAGSKPAARDTSPFASPLTSRTTTMPTTDTAGPVHGTPRKVPATEAQVRAQLDEIQSLRRDLAIMRQFHVDFLSETKEAFAKLRKENSAMRDLVKTKMGGSRAILDNSKVKLEVLCGETIQAVEEVLDVIEAAREDAFKRYVHPSRTQMTKIQADLKKANDLVTAFTAEVTSMEPTWRATWHLELSRVMEEQKLLPHQLSLAQDLKKDISDGMEMFKNVSDFVDQRTTNAAKGLRSAFRPPTPDETGGGVQNLLMEIRTKESDPNQRLRAIEAQQRAREKEKANKTDEFQDELAGFVAGKKLKKTGGTDEVDRTRQRKQDQTIRRMLSGSGGDAGSPTGLGLLSPQMTGASITSLTSSGTATTTTATGQMGLGLRTTSSASNRSEDGRKGES